MVMKNGMKLPCYFTECNEDQGFVSRGGAMGGMLKFSLQFELVPKEANKTEVIYTFAFGGFLGALMGLAVSPIQGVEEGLKNVVELSEKAENEGK